MLLYKDGLIMCVCTYLNVLFLHINENLLGDKISSHIDWQFIHNQLCWVTGICFK